MIKNQKQYGVAKKRLAELKYDQYDFEKENIDKNTAKYRFGNEALNNLINEIETEINEFMYLTEHNGLIRIKSNSSKELPSLLIKARLARRMSHKDLADKLSIDEQQIQRYEATEYESASWSRIRQVMMALELNVQLEKVCVGEIKFEHPVEISERQIHAAEVQVRHSCLFPIKASL